MLLVLIVLQSVTLGAVLGLRRDFGAFARTAKALYTEVTQLRDENRRFRELHETLTKQKSA